MKQFTGDALTRISIATGMRLRPEMAKLLNLGNRAWLIVVIASLWLFFSFLRVHHSQVEKTAFVIPTVSRRSKLLALVASATFPKEVARADEDCSCCTQDWCHCRQGACDCHAYLKAQGYRLPLDAPTAFSLAGELEWSKMLAWQSATLPAWSPVDSERLDVRNSSFPGAGFGLFAESSLGNGTIIAPYRGMVLTKADLVRAEYGRSWGNYVWCPSAYTAQMQDEDDDDDVKMSSSQWLAPTYCIDSELAAEENPARFINGARSQEQCASVNVEICELGQVAYMRTTRPVPRGAELIVNYGSRYWSDFSGC